MNNPGYVVDKSGQVTRLIAYLSLCMLAAAFGAMLDPAWCRWWAIFGAFGLASAIGLDVLARSRAWFRDHERRRQLALQVERNLDKIMGDRQSSDVIRAAVGRIQPDAKGPKSQGSDDQAEPRLPLDRPVTITPLRRLSGAVDDRLGEIFAGRVQNISHRGVGLTHDACLERGPVLLEFEFEDGEPLQFVADLLWCELQDGGRYFSGGKLVALVDPNDARSAAAESTLAGVEA